MAVIFAATLQGSTGMIPLLQMRGLWPEEVMRPGYFQGHQERLGLAVFSCLPWVLVLALCLALLQVLGTHWISHSPALKGITDQRFYLQFLEGMPFFVCFAQDASLTLACLAHSYSPLKKPIQR